jgi:oligopeptide/dipeptide ABC transporter ATP-binding protein
LETVGLPTRLVDEYPSALSIGMQQRACIARAIASSPRLIVLDEPTSALPPESEADIMALLEDLRARLNLTYVLITHDLSLVRRLCGRVAVMYLGQIVETGDCRTIFAKPQHPYTRALIDSILEWDPHHPRRARPDKQRDHGELPSAVSRPPGCFFASRCPHVLSRCTTEPQQLEPALNEIQVRCWRSTQQGLRI